MIEILGRCSEFMDGGPVRGATLELKVVVTAYWESGATMPIELSSSTVTGADGRFQIVLDASNAFASRREERFDGKAPDDVSAVIAVKASHLGLSRWILDQAIWRESIRLTEVNAVFDYGKSIVGHVTAGSAMIWFCRHGDVPAGENHSLRIRLSAGTSQWTSVPLQLDSTRANSSTVLLSRLIAGTAYDYQVWRDGDPIPFAVQREEASVQFRERNPSVTLARGSFRTAPAIPARPPSSNRLEFAFTSCHLPTDDASMERWRALAATRDFDLMLLIGDQIYENGLAEKSGSWLGRYQQRYHEYWSYRPMRQVLREVPTYMIWDDHEIMDDWGSRFTRNDPNLDQRFEAAEQAYRTFQQSHNPGGVNALVNYYYFRRGPAAFFFMDNRKFRGTDPDFPVFGRTQFEAIETWTRSPEVRQADAIFFISPTPVAFLPVEELQKLKDQANTAAREMIASAGALLGGVLAGPGGAIAGAYLGYQVGSIGAHYAERHLLEEDFRTKFDLDDHWTANRNLNDTGRLLDLLFDLANDTDQGHKHKRAVFILGGDVHMGAFHVIRSNKKSHEPNSYILQVTSSPISHEPPSGSNGRLFQDLVSHIRDDLALHDLILSGFEMPEGVAHFNLGPEHRSILRDHRGGRVKSQEEKWRYDAIFGGLCPERNFGRIGVQRVGDEGTERRYRFSITIEGQSGNPVRKVVQYDLDRDQVTPLEV